MYKKNNNILIIGAGSAGKRHMLNLLELGCSLSAFDPNKNKLDAVKKEISNLNCFHSFEQTLPHWDDFDGVVVASPPKFHKEQCIFAIKKAKPVLVEKPLTRTLSEGSEIFKSIKVGTHPSLLLGYTYRWWPPLRKMRSLLRGGAVGKPLHAKFIMSAHLADWHPWERYQDFFMSSKDLGGGALLDESHFIDLMVWFFGMPEKVTAKIDKLSDLEIDTDDNVDIIFEYSDGLRVFIHLDLFGRPHEKYIKISGEGSTIEWTFEPNQLQLSDKIEPLWEVQQFNCERNDMFKSLAKDFLDMVKAEAKPSCTLVDGLNVMKLIDACRESNEKNQTIKL